MARVGFLVVGLLFTCCTGGSESGLREGDIVQRAEVCIELACNLCIGLTECGLVSDRGSCETEFVDACCGNEGLCGQQVQLKKSTESCIEDFESLTCQEIDNDVFPVACVGLI
jgi:hypothetical protein